MPSESRERAFSAFTTQGMPSSRETMAAWDVSPPSSATMAEASFMAGTYSLSVAPTTRTAPLIIFSLASAALPAMHTGPLASRFRRERPLRRIVPAMWTWSMFVVPAAPRGTPAVTTTRSPSLISPALMQEAIAESTAVFWSVISSFMRGMTPQYRASSRQVLTDGVAPRMGHGGLCLLTIWAVLPLWVMEMMAAAFIWRATRTEALLTASGTPMVFDAL
ncbi:hypothetical protein SDC9_43005 [bioreactor metagenome]|uniref:Uncharacterized protein n=1 Tax=bioreactor metagenome TaxID=1076179 RepID=A0A644VZG3_9ZZZZ